MAYSTILTTYLPDYEEALRLAQSRDASEFVHIRLDATDDAEIRSMIDAVDHFIVNVVDFAVPTIHLWLQVRTNSRNDVIRQFHSI